MNRKKLITTLIIVGVVPFSILQILKIQTWPAQVVINHRVINVEVADNTVLQQKGLSGHKKLLPNEGMFFVFTKVGEQDFWMKDMTFPLDIIWIDENLKVVHIEKSLDPKTYPKIYFSSTPALYVLEIMAGQSDVLKIATGTTVTFLKK